VPRVGAETKTGSCSYVHFGMLARRGLNCQNEHDRTIPGHSRSLFAGVGLERQDDFVVAESGLKGEEQEEQTPVSSVGDIAEAVVAAAVTNFASAAAVVVAGVRAVADVEADAMGSGAVGGHADAAVAVGPVGELVVLVPQIRLVPRRFRMPLLRKRWIPRQPWPIGKKNNRKNKNTERVNSVRSEIKRSMDPPVPTNVVAPIFRYSPRRFDFASRNLETYVADLLVGL